MEEKIPVSIWQHHIKRLVLKRRSKAIKKSFIPHAIVGEEYHG
jgi:hypothetical protein